MNNLQYLFAANVFIWGGIFVYVFSLAKRNNALRRDLDLLKESLKKESQP